MIILSSTPSPYDFGTMATYQCNGGFGLRGGDVTRTCGGDGSSPNGMWSGIPPMCEGTYNIIPHRSGVVIVVSKQP